PLHLSTAMTNCQLTLPEHDKTSIKSDQLPIYTQRNGHRRAYTRVLPLVSRSYRGRWGMVLNVAVGTMERTAVGVSDRDAHRGYIAVPVASRSRVAFPVPLLVHQSPPASLGGVLD
ncbi:MAG: hypothetical protein L0Y56_16790, partial [Nitrospira sp.]|nr:hypothetical protein [Nitrospira sp.]